MKRLAFYGAIVVLIFGAVSIVAGAVFISQGQSKNQFMVDGLRAERVTLGLGEDAIQAGEVVDTMGEAETAAATITQHLRDRYGTYADTPRDSAERATYLDGLALITSLNQAVMGFGMVTVVTVSGILLIVMGISGGTVGAMLLGVARRRI